MAFDGHRWWVDEGRGSRQTSRFDKGEAGSFAAGIADIRVSMTDMVWVSEGGHVSLLREGDYPPLRGTFAQTGENGLLYTRGSVPYHGTYPGARVPGCPIRCSHGPTRTTKRRRTGSRRRSSH